LVPFAWCFPFCFISSSIYNSFTMYPLKVSTLWGRAQNCCHIVLFFRGPMFELRPCNYYERFLQCFCILW
jgi:hypothetical protein